MQSAQNTKFALDNVRPESSLQNLVSKFCIESDEIKKSGINFIAAIGSERGWTDAERALLAEKGFTLCSMGKRVLRTETAATVSASIILSSLGFLD